MVVSFAAASTSADAVLSASRGDRASSASQRPVAASSRENAGGQVRLSPLGQVQSATVRVQTAARNLQNPDLTETLAQAKQAAENFVDALNSERTALTNVTGAGGNGAAAGVPSDDGQARVAASQLDVGVNASAGAFRDVGIRLQQDGSLSVDAKALEAAFNTNPSAVRQALGSIGQAAETTATRRLSDADSVGATVSNPASRVQQPETLQADNSSNADQSRRALESASRRYGFGATGAGAYLGIFGL